MAAVSEAKREEGGELQIHVPLLNTVSIEKLGIFEKVKIFIYVIIFINESHLLLL